jgi:uncharacterized protein YqeY
MLIDGAEKIAKAENRSVTEKDVQQVALRSIKELEKDVALILEKGGELDTEEVEIGIYKEFIPTFLTKEETLYHIKHVYASDVLIKKNFGLIMKEQKSDKIDSSVLSAILKELLK